MKSRSWFFTWLKVLVCSWSVCWGSVNALADNTTSQPSHLHGQQYRVGPHQQYVITYHRELTNQLIAGSQLQRAEVLAAGVALEEARNEMKENGNMQVWTNWVLQNAALFEASTVNFSHYYPQMAGQEYDGLETVLVKIAETETQAERIAFVKLVQQTGGMENIFNALITQVNAIANALPIHGPLIPPCHLLNGTAAWMGMAAAVSGLIALGGFPLAIGATAVFGFVSATFAWSAYMYGC